MKAHYTFNGEKLEDKNEAHQVDGFEEAIQIGREFISRSPSIQSVEIRMGGNVITIERTARWEANQNPVTLANGQRLAIGHKLDRSLEMPSAIGSP